MADGPKEVFGSERPLDFIQERKFMPPPTSSQDQPYDYAPFDEHLMRVIARKELHNSIASRLVRWLMSSGFSEKVLFVCYLLEQVRTKCLDVRIWFDVVFFPLQRVSEIMEFFVQKFKI